ncbi:hypothetical protein BLAT2472_50317 [Burkholderia latens]
MHATSTEGTRCHFHITSTSSARPGLAAALTGTRRPHVPTSCSAHHERAATGIATTADAFERTRIADRATATTQIGAYRRAVCGDLASAFNFRAPNHEPLPTLAGRATKSDVDALSAAQQAAPKIAPPAAPSLPAQAIRVCPSRALPYELHARARKRTHATASSR